MRKHVLNACNNKPNTRIQYKERSSKCTWIFNEHSMEPHIDVAKHFEYSTICNISLIIDKEYLPTCQELRGFFSLDFDIDLASCLSARFRACDFAKWVYFLKRKTNICHHYKWLKICQSWQNEHKRHSFTMWNSRVVIWKSP